MGETEVDGQQANPLSVRGIDALPIPISGLKDHKDGKVPGLCLRVFESGHRTWMLKYRQDGRQRRLKLGDYPQLGLSDARKEAEQKRVAIRNGVDLIQERRKKNGAETLEALITQYLDEHARPNLAPSSAQEYERVLMGPDFTGLRRLPAAAVTDAEVAEALNRIERRGSMTLLNRAQSYLSAVFTWASPRRYAGVVSNPVRGLPRRHNERGNAKRFLTPDEIRIVLRAIESLESVPQWAVVAMWLILATGQRPGEVLQARWEHIDLELARWEMPRSYRKRVGTQREAPPHDVPLSPILVALLQRLDRKRSGYVFSARTKSGHKSTTALNQRVQRGLLKALDEHSVVVERFTPNDLRRTCSTHLHRMGVPHHVVEKTIGHFDSSVAGVYDRYEYWEERRDALNTWSEELESALSGSNNVPPPCDPAQDT
jgi:integrase